MAEMTMRSVIEALGLTHQFEIKATSGNYICPVCGDPSKPRKKKLNIDFQKNQFRCVICEFQGGPHAFWAYYRNMEGEKTKKIWDDYDKYIGAPDKAEIRRRIQSPPPVPKIVEHPIAEINTRHATYTALLNSLTLSEKHKENLLKRGLSEEEIIKGGYKTAPMAGTSALCHTILRKGFPLEGVPGFYKYKGVSWDFVKYGAGFLIPVRDIEGRIQALQLRCDDVQEGGTRYFTISSANKDDGTKGVAVPHFNPGTKGCKKLIITEGPLKGDITSYYTGLSTLAVLGVKNLSAIPSILKELKEEKGTKYVYVAYDADRHENEHVYAAYEKLLHIISSVGFTFSTLDWPKEHKGIDDYVHYLHSQQKTNSQD